MPETPRKKTYNRTTSDNKAQRSEPKFLDQVASACRYQQYSYRTEKSYVYWVKHGL